MEAMDATLRSGFVVRGLCLGPLLANWNCGLWGSVLDWRKILTHWNHMFSLVLRRLTLGG